MPITKISRRMETRLAQLSSADASLVRCFFTKHSLREEYEIRDWVDKHLCEYVELSAQTNVKQVEDLERGRKVYSILTGKPFAPDTFSHQSLSLDIVRGLAFGFGTRELFETAVRAGIPLGREGKYTAWIFGLISLEELSEVPPRIDRRAWKQTKKKKKGPETRRN